ncbi:hypothetical protein ACFSJ3_02535 [Corallincola platygyrae]|uniref:Uncharacterized protein n=1 Tax=Corallincola platygyrae TaxID=1193278 RepID=A0ABW4XH49_9GAMM
MLKRPIYELLPYFYLAGGFVCIANFEFGWGQLFAILLFLLGADIWIMRSNSRRQDKVLKRRVQDRLKPFWLYEVMPFLLVCISGVVISTSGSNYLSWAMVLPVGYAFWRIEQRVEYRQHGWVQLTDAQLS